MGWNHKRDYKDAYSTKPGFLMKSKGTKAVFFFRDSLLEPEEFT